MLVQAGASSRGITFAARHAELIIAIQPSPQLMRDYRRSIQEALTKTGRDPGRGEGDVRDAYVHRGQ
jgi:alkanesulfonate monooxygenase SsuD/methylene tetrahydromethanopterin reductase-like flavin-dependent oxidoreductase (luciferase family)